VVQTFNFFRSFNVTHFKDVLVACPSRPTVVSYEALHYITLIGTVIFGVEALLQAIFSWKSYSRSRENLLECFIVVCTFGYFAAVDYNILASRHLAAWSVFFGWLKLTLLIGRFPSIGIYIYMSVNIIKSLFIFILVSFILGLSRDYSINFLPRNLKICDYGQIFL